MPSRTVETPDYFRVRHGWHNPTLTLLYPFVLVPALAAVLLIWYGLLSILFWPIISALFGAVVFSLIPFLYSRRISMNDRGYSESACFCGLTLWMELYAPEDLLDFKVEETFPTSEDTSAYCVVLQLRNGERRNGMSYFSKAAAEASCHALNAVLVRARAAA